MVHLFSGISVTHSTVITHLVFSCLFLCTLPLQQYFGKHEGALKPSNRCDTNGELHAKWTGSDIPFVLIFTTSNHSLPFWWVASKSSLTKDINCYHLDCLLKMKASSKTADLCKNCKFPYMCSTWFHLVLIIYLPCDLIFGCSFLVVIFNQTKQCIVTLGRSSVM